MYLSFHILLVLQFVSAALSQSSLNSDLSKPSNSIRKEQDGTFGERLNSFISYFHIANYEAHRPFAIKEDTNVISYNQKVEIKHQPVHRKSSTSNTRTDDSITQIANHDINANKALHKRANIQITDFTTISSTTTETVKVIFNLTLYVSDTTTINSTTTTTVPYTLYNPVYNTTFTTFTETLIDTETLSNTITETFLARKISTVDITSTSTETFTLDETITEDVFSDVTDTITEIDSTTTFTESESTIISYTTTTVPTETITRTIFESA